MNKQELIDKLTVIKGTIISNEEDRYYKGRDAAYEVAINWVKELDEPELPVIPKFVADWIKECKVYEHNLFGVYEFAPEVVSDWIFENESKKERVDLIARAWLYDYRIEKEPYWIVSFQAKDFYDLLDEISYFKEFITDREKSIRIKPNGYTFKDDSNVYKFKEKEKAEAVALLIGGEVVVMPNE